LAGSRDGGSTREGERFARLARGVRLDLVIAVCALLVSSLATAASWWQTRVIQQQLSAQVWPYMSVSETVGPDRFDVDFKNDGLGPAVLRSVLIEVDGKPVGGFVDLLHAVIGPHLMSRVRHGERLSLDLSTFSPGDVLRAGEAHHVFSLTSKRYAPLLFDKYKRIDFRACYCAIVPGSCWLTDSLSGGDPQQLAACPPVSRDLLKSDDAFASRRF
jgi:hypothetical protein